MLSVDLASIDRRDMTSEVASTNRVRGLRESYLRSDVHTDVMLDMKESAELCRGRGVDENTSSCKYGQQCVRFVPLFSVLIR